MPLSQQVARFNRRVTNRITKRFAGRLPGFAILTHVGRKSGKTYRTPINAFRDGNDYIFALTYGPDTDWMRNVQAAGGCEILTRGQQISLTNPRLVTDTRNSWAPLPVRLVLTLTGVTQYLRMTRATTSAAPAPQNTSQQLSHLTNR
jgi:deazaflavin-dependent oxidoreductase (nitroreductase family)